MCLVALRNLEEISSLNGKKLQPNHTACGILAPRPGIEPTSPSLEGRFLTTGPRGKSLGCHLKCMPSNFKKLVFTHVARTSCSLDLKSVIFILLKDPLQSNPYFTKTLYPSTLPALTPNPQKLSPTLLQSHAGHIYMHFEII